MHHPDAVTAIVITRIPRVIALASPFATLGIVARSTRCPRFAVVVTCIPCLASPVSPLVAPTLATLHVVLPTPPPPHPSILQWRRPSLRQCVCRLQHHTSCPQEGRQSVAAGAMHFPYLAAQLTRSQQRHPALASSHVVACSTAPCLQQPQPGLQQCTRRLQDPLLCSQQGGRPVVASFLCSNNNTKRRYREEKALAR